MGIRNPSYYSKRMNRIVGAKSAIATMSDGFRKRGDKFKDRRKSESDIAEQIPAEQTEEEKEKKMVMETIMSELKIRIEISTILIQEKEHVNSLMLLMMMA